MLAALGGFILCFRKPPPGTLLPSPAPPPADLLEAITAVASIVRACGGGWDGVCLAVGMPSGVVGSTPPIPPPPGEGSGTTEQEDEEEETLEILCRMWGFEYVDFERSGRNDYGEAVGMERVREALEANDWDEGGGGYGDYDYDEFSAGGGGGEGGGEGGDGGDGGDDVDAGVLGAVAGEFEAEMVGVRRAIWQDAGDDGLEEEVDGEHEEDEAEQRRQLEEMERVMAKMAMLRDLGGGGGGGGDGEGDRDGDGDGDGDREKKSREREKRWLARELLREIMKGGETVEGEGVD